MVSFRHCFTSEAPVSWSPSTNFSRKAPVLLKMLNVMRAGCKLHATDTGGRENGKVRHADRKVVVTVLLCREQYRQEKWQHMKAIVREVK